MADEQPQHRIHETTPQRVERVAGAPLKADPANRWLLMVALALLFVALVIVGAGIAIGLGAGGIFDRYTEQIEKADPGAGKP